jgi:hypothetical protein
MRALTTFTTPARGDRSAFSIFMASTTSNSSPLATTRPGAAFTAITLPGIGASRLLEGARGAEGDPSLESDNR